MVSSWLQAAAADPNVCSPPTFVNLFITVVNLTHQKCPFDRKVYTGMKTEAKERKTKERWKCNLYSWICNRSLVSQAGYMSPPQDEADSAHGSCRAGPSGAQRDPHSNPLPPTGPGPREGTERHVPTTLVQGEVQGHPFAPHIWSCRTSAVLSIPVYHQRRQQCWGGILGWHNRMLAAYRLGGETRFPPQNHFKIPWKNSPYKNPHANVLFVKNCSQGWAGQAAASSHCCMYGYALTVPVNISLCCKLAFHYRRKY